MKIKNALSGSTLGILHYLHKRKVVIIIGAVIMTLGFFGALAVGNIVINDAENNRLTPQGYPQTQFLGISAFSYEYGLVFTGIVGFFIFFGGLVGMDSKKEKKLKK
jgi:hypothetical protein